MFLNVLCLISKFVRSRIRVPPLISFRRTFQPLVLIMTPPLINFSTFLEEICKKVGAVTQLPK